MHKTFIVITVVIVIAISLRIIDAIIVPAYPKSWNMIHSGMDAVDINKIDKGIDIPIGLRGVLPTQMIGSGNGWTISIDIGHDSESRMIRIKYLGFSFYNHNIE